MNELIKIETKDNGENLVNGRELHEFLESKQDFTTWIKNKIEKYGFIEDEDFTLHKIMVGKNWVHNYILKLDIAKEIAMVEGNEKGKQARLYFIACEKKLKELAPKIPKSYAEALLEAGRLALENEKLEKENRAKQEVIERKTEIIDNMTEDLDEVRIRKIVTDYISRYVKAKGMEYSEAYNDLYSFFGRAIKTDVEYQYKKYLKNQNEIALENKAYNRENNLKGIDRKMPCVQCKTTKIGFIVNILNKGGDLVDCMAKFFEVPIETILDKYKSMERIITE